MSMPKTLKEWREVSPAWRETARALVPPDGYSGSRRRPRDPGEVRALRRIGADRQKPFVEEASDAALQIRMARKRAGISQTELAVRLGITQQQVQRLEDPDNSNPTVATLRAVARALGRSLSISFDQADGLGSRRAGRQG
jgi:DNA-binding XRE family transcriptional regulator